jgi:hypothetical protein
LTWLLVPVMHRLLALIDFLLVPTSTLSAMHPLYLPCFHFIRHASTAVDASLLMHAVDASLLMTLMHPHRWCTDFWGIFWGIDLTFDASTLELTCYFYFSINLQL